MIIYIDKLSEDANNNIFLPDKGRSLILVSGGGEAIGVGGFDEKFVAESEYIWRKKTCLMTT